MSGYSELSQKWINNIRKLDKKYSLSHGEFYARDGSVFELNINDNIVNAKVQGAPGDIYNVEIIFLKLTKNHIDYLTKYIKNNPLIYSKLLNNQLSEELFQTKVKILPTSIKEFKMKCDCEKGLFCKHKAAVFHKLAEEIAKNPFLVFTLIGFDINKLFDEESHKITNIHEILNNDSEIKLTESHDINHLVKLNYLLSDFPPFYKSNAVNFNELICDTLSSMAQSIYRIHNSKVSSEFQELIILGNTLRSYDLFSSKSQEEIHDAFEKKWEYPLNWDEFKIDLNENYEINKITTGEEYNNFFMTNLKYTLFAFLAEINQVNTDLYCEEIRFLHQLYLFTSKLINSTALIPEFFTLENKEYHVRWIPAFEKTVYDELEYFHKNCPDDLLTFNGEKLSKQNQVKTLISLIFEGFTYYYVNKYMPRKLTSYINETFYRLFFIKSQDLKKYSIKNDPIEIQNWISPLYLNQNDYTLVLVTEQVDDEFIFSLKIRLNNELYDFKDIIELKRTDIIINIPVIKNILSKSGIQYNFSSNQKINLNEYLFFLETVLPVLNECGVEVKIPQEFKTVNEIKLVLNTNTPSSSLTLDDLVNFDWKIAIGDETFSIDEFELFSNSYRGLIKLKDKYIRVNDEKLNQIIQSIENIPESQDKSEIMRYLLSNDSENVEMDYKIEDLINNILKVQPVEIPKSLNGTLREYQKTGFSWMIQNMQLGFGSILADDMGLGKTIQIITLILYLKENNKLNDEKVLITVPTSILTNWAREINKFAPSLNVEIYHGLNRQYPTDDFDILLTSYGMIRQDLDEFKDKWFLIVIDEAQNIKNPNTKQTKAIKSINAIHHIALSGTPIENHLSEYWSIFDFTNKGYLNNLKNFKKRFIKPIEKERDEFILNDFKNITKPFILRRLKTDKNIVKELPDKIINDIYCNLSVKQASLYDETLNVLINDVENSEGIQRKGLVLKLINALKQICNHPSQYLKLDDAKVNESGKMEVLMNIVENIILSDEKVIIFTQYIKMGNILKKLLEEKFSEEVLFLNGEVSRVNRDKMIDNFQNGKVKIFILSLKAGGTGLNLTAATNVIHYDLWWNPAVENQATDRAYRIGQTENVMVYRFITTGTLEERINQILIEKRELVDMAISSEESFITEMSNEELKEMLNLRSEK